MHTELAAVLLQVFLQKRRVTGYVPVSIDIIAHGCDCMLADANRQHDLGSDLGTDPDQSSFRRAMLLAKRVLLVMDPGAVVLSRIWVDFEIFKTVTHSNIDIASAGFDISTFSDGKPHVLMSKLPADETHFQRNSRESHFPMQLLSDGMSSELQNGDASMEIDKVLSN